MKDNKQNKSAQKISNEEIIENEPCDCASDNHECGCSGSHEGHEHHCHHEHSHTDCCEEHSGHHHGHSHDGEHCTCGHDHDHSHNGEHCACGHSHSHSHGCACCDDSPIKVDKSQKVWQVDKKELACVILSALLLVIAFVLEHTLGEKAFWGYLVVYILAYLPVAIGSMAEGFRGLLKKDIFNENTLMNVASIGAFCIGEFEEGVAVMLLYTVGEIIQGISVRKSKKSIGELLDIRVDKSQKISEDGNTVEVDTSTLKIGDKVLIKAGEKVPVDGKIIQGASSFDYSKLTGESIPVAIGEGEELLGGTLNLESSVVLEVQKEQNDSTASKILRLVEDAQKNKPQAEKFVRKFAKIYTPIVFAIALCIAVFAPMVSSLSYNQSIIKGLVFLVISCPCALVISTPLTYFGGIGSASRRGVLVKGGNYLEMLNNIDEICFDKTGTLTEGKLEVVEIQGKDKELLKKVAGACENLSNHPIANCISEYCNTKERAENSKEIAGKGMLCMYKGKIALLGNEKLMQEYGIDFEQNTSIASKVYVAYDNKYLGCICLADKVRENAKNTIEKLKKLGKSTVMLTGDNATVAEQVCKQTGIDKYMASLMPQDKSAYVEEQVKAGKNIMFVGDGLNDAPAIRHASIGACIGGIGNDASVEASDMVLIGGNIDRLEDAFKVAKKTKKIIAQNIAMALGIKFAIMAICMFVNPIMWLAVVADVGVCLLAILNSMRTLRIKQ